MTIGELVKAISDAGKQLQRANPDLSLEDFHAIEIVVRAHDDNDDHDFAGDLRSAGIEFSHGDDEPYLALDANNDE